MGVIWLQTTDGKLIHIPIVGADYNTPDTPTKIPTSIFDTEANRCMNGTYNVNIPGVGTVTIDLDPPGRTGSCNACGQCCSHPAAGCAGGCGYVTDGAFHRCTYLTIKPRGIGKSNGTECSIRATILNVSKGCVMFPTDASDIVGYDACGFTFGG